jgi:hypothetical protein
MSVVTVPDFRVWSGANTPASTPDAVIQSALDEAEAGLLAEVGATLGEITIHPHAISIAKGDEMRRASRLIARRNSPEGIAGAGAEGVISIPSRDPDSAASVRMIRSLLLVPEGVA